MRSESGRLIDEVLEGFARLVRATEKKAKTDPVQGLVEDLDLRVEPLFEELQEAAMMAIDTGRGDSAAVLGVELGRPPAKAIEWAEERAAKLVGMKVLKSGRLVVNPNPRWAITETIRDSIRGKVATALKEGWSPQDLAAAIRKDVFSASRAENIARTETGFAYNEGVAETYEEQGLDLVELLDGDGCLPDGHEEGAPKASREVGVVELEREANGQIWPVSEIRRRPLGHPRCVRDFIPYQGRRAA